MILGEVVSDIFMIFVRSDFVIIFRVYIDVRDICRILGDVVGYDVVSYIFSVQGYDISDIFSIWG